MISLEELEALDFSGKLSEVEIGEVSLKGSKALLPRHFPSGLWVIGIDPGKHFGIVEIRGKEMFVRSGDLISDTSHYGEQAYDFALEYLPTLNPILTELQGFEAPLVVIEGPAYKDNQGQVILAEGRFGFHLGFRQAGCKVISYLPPNTIRKAAFGHGNLAGWQVWPLLKEHEADAIGCAIYAASLASDSSSGPAP